MTVLFKGFPETDEYQADAMLKACGITHDLDADIITIKSINKRQTVIKHMAYCDDKYIPTYLVAYETMVRDGIVHYELSHMDGYDLNAVFRAFGEVLVHV